mmetsp:Transcript_11253/g.22398  ORF Transcript_11253/g.22398 Transcript_11253/m.22398 type:complete len:236 (-) Transcript_11253:157-864(-)
MGRWIGEFSSPDQNFLRRFQCIVPYFGLRRRNGRRSTDSIHVVVSRGIVIARILTISERGGGGGKVVQKLDGLLFPGPNDADIVAHVPHGGCVSSVRCGVDAASAGDAETRSNQTLDGFVTVKFSSGEGIECRFGYEREGCRSEQMLGWRWFFVYLLLLLLLLFRFRRGSIALVSHEMDGDFHDGRWWRFVRLGVKSDIASRVYCGRSQGPRNGRRFPSLGQNDGKEGSVDDPPV